jgi:hypothetical protein
MKNGAGNEIRTRDLNLGKVALYQLSYSRLNLIYLSPPGFWLSPPGSGLAHMARGTEPAFSPPIGPEPINQGILSESIPLARNKLASPRGLEPLLPP